MTTLILVLAAPTHGGWEIFPPYIGVPIFIAVFAFVLYRKFGSRRK